MRQASAQVIPMRPPAWTIWRNGLRTRTVSRRRSSRSGAHGRIGPAQASAASPQQGGECTNG